jgi:hypothetical protein
MKSWTTGVVVSDRYRLILMCGRRDSGSNTRGIFRQDRGGKSAYQQQNG